MARQLSATPSVVSREETAAYVADLAGDLAILARHSGLDTLAYLLDVARLEAENIGRKEPDSD